MSESVVSQERSTVVNSRLEFLVEAGVVILLLAALVAQLMTYPPTYSVDPDGYVTYADYLLEHRTLIPGYRRLPGYPMFLALVSKLTPASLPDNVWWVQGFMMMLLSIISWACIRRWFGRLPAAVLLGIIAAPCYFTRMSVVMLTDMVYSVLMLPILIAMGWWAFKPGSGVVWLWCIPFALGLFVTQAIRPTTFLIGLLFGPAILVGYMVSRALRDKAGQIGVRLILARAVVIVLLAFGAFAAVDAFLDTGARAYNSMVFAYRVVLTLPPASDTRADRRIESAKARFETIEGQPLWSSHFLTYRTFNPWQELRADDVQEVWKARLWHSPGLYLLSIFDDIKYNHYYVLLRFTPFFFDLDRTNLFGYTFPPVDNSPTSNIFLASGLVIYVLPDTPLTIVNGELGRAVMKFITVWSLVILGCWQLARYFCSLTVTFVVLILLFSLTLSASNTIDGRYLLPFAMFIYLAQAMGIAWVVQRLLYRKIKASTAPCGG